MGYFLFENRVAFHCSFQPNIYSIGQCLRLGSDVSSRHDSLLGLESKRAVGGTHLTEPIDSLGITAENLVTNKVTTISAITPGKPLDYPVSAVNCRF